MGRTILFYTHAFGGGGAEIVFRRLAEAFAADGDRVLATADFQGPEPVCDKPRLRHVQLGPGHWRSLVQLARLLRAERPDASFSALGAQNLKHLAAAMLARRTRHCVLGFHGFAAVESRPLARSCFWLAPLVTRLAARTICVSDVLLEDMRRRWGASTARTIRIYNPLPWPVAASGASPFGRDPQRPPLIVALGRLVPSKRFCDLVAALALVEPKTTQLAIIGTGPALPALEDCIARFGLQGRVLLPGHVNDPTPYYRQAACVAISSESESFGLTAAEALAFGTPVVTTDCGGPREILDGGRLGRVVHVGDVSALAAALSTAIMSPGNDEARRRRGRSFALEVVHRQYAALADMLSPDDTVKTLRHEPE